MAQYKVKDPEELAECPYDPVHMIRAKRFPYHLMKCRKNYTGNDYVKCPFNACHEFPRPELRYHVANCPDRVLIEKDVVYDETKNKGRGTYFRGYTEIPDQVASWSPTSRENWDREISPIPVQVVDKSIFTGKHISRNDFLFSNPHEKLQFMEKLKERGIPLDSSLTSSEPETLRLPHQPPRVLTSARQVSCQKPLNCLRQDEDYQKNLKKNVALLQSLALGRGKSVTCDMTQAPSVGQRSQE